MAQKQDRPLIKKKGGDGAGSEQDQSTLTTLDRPEIGTTVNAIDELLKRTKARQPRRSGCGCGW